MRYRQIHLDFHTSPVIDDVASCFDADDFVRTLKEAHVNSINIFAKCHHGMCYYPTKVGTMHPSLRFDLLGEMIRVLHENGITCPIYFPLGWEEDAATHTDWLEIGRDQIPGHKRSDDATYNRWKKLCLGNREYIEYIKKQLTELMDNYDVDGFWFDIIFQQKCLCPTCLREMRSMHLDPECERDVLWHDELVLRRLQQELNDFIHAKCAGMPTFYNSSWAPNSGVNDTSIDVRSYCQDHMEIESLPSGDWGYNHFPLFVNYHNRNNRDVIGMNGKFHLTWGDHGSLKNQEALEFECFRMIANGAACSVGDQLHPRGFMNKPAYARIGRIYSEIEKMEPMICDTQKVAEIGVIVSTDFYDRISDSDEGALRMLSELHYTFDFIPQTDDLSKYELVILPDHVGIDADFSRKLSEYLNAGGKVIATHKSIDADSMGINLLSDAEYEPAYVVIPDGLIKDVEPLEYVCYRRGVYVSSDLPVKAYVGNPYYNRTADCFSSHRQFPFKESSEYPAILLSDQIGYCSFELFADYIINGNRIYRDIIRYLLESLLPKKLVCSDLPTCAEITVRKKEQNMLLHILSYIPERRTKTIDIVDTRLPLHNANVKLRLDEHSEITRVYSLRTGTTYPFTVEDGYICITIPEINGYECVVFSMK